MPVHIQFIAKIVINYNAKIIVIITNINLFIT